MASLTVAGKRASMFENRATQGEERGEAADHEVMKAFNKVGYTRVVGVVRTRDRTPVHAEQARRHKK